MEYLPFKPTPQPLLTPIAINILKESNLCLRCQQLFPAAWGIENRGGQLRTILDLQNSASEACDFCKALLNSLDTYYTSNTKSPEYKIRLSANEIFGQVDIEDGPGQGSYQVRPHQIMINFPDRNQLGFVGADSTSEMSLSFVLRMLNQCISTHQHCYKAEEQPLPKRILHVGLKSDATVKLVETPQKRARYACLSHCWGKTESIKTTSENLDDFKIQIPWDGLPRLYRDVISFCRALRIQYIWIDALCIKQDDASDWEEESSKMATIYESSYITIAATVAPNHDCSCTTSLDPKYQLREVGKICQMGSSTSYPILIRETLPHPENLSQIYCDSSLQRKYPLFSRAWAYQERILSPRVIHFLHDELLWECRHGLECECQGVKPRSRMSQIYLPTKYLNNDTWFESVCRDDKCPCGKSRRWGRILDDYARLNLTVPGDRLPAISGLARRMQGPPQDRYLAGIWESDLPDALFWKAPYHIRSAPLPRPQTPTAPTWSWAAIPGTRDHGINSFACTGGVKNRKYPVRVESIDVKPRTINPYGSVTTDSKIVISGALGSGCLRYGGARDIFVVAETGTEIKFVADYELRRPGPYYVAEGTKLVCLYRDCDDGYGFCVLILRGVGEHGSQYERLGLAQWFLSTGDEPFDSGPEHAKASASAHARRGVITLI
ncbi:heterokaryon incompatibility protein-domain-containing protein [Xylaria sp. FL1777]|nr:heterokaryon incompatibility protein-domain-containing protein [Xylaria sp. FL1777]